MGKKSQQEKSFRRELVTQLLTLSTSGFGFVAALAWNEAVQAFVKDYIEKYLPSQSGAISKLLYAIFITLFAVLITYQLSIIKDCLPLGNKNIFKILKRLI